MWETKFSFQNLGDTTDRLLLAVVSQCRLKFIGTHSSTSPWGCTRWSWTGEVKSKTQTSQEDFYWDVLPTPTVAKGDWAHLDWGAEEETATAKKS